jgi:SulP family sulfate permease
MKIDVGKELIAGAISALVMLPQAVILATLAGMPPEHGIYASVFPAIVASVFGMHRLLLTGPNTAVALMAGSVVASIAALESPAYVALMLLLSLLIGLVQFWIGLAGGEALLRYLPNTALPSVMSGAGLTIILSQLNIVTGRPYLHDDAAWINAWRCLIEADSWDAGALLTGVATVASAAALGRTRAAKLALPAAVAVGACVALLWSCASGRALDMLGRLQVAMLAPSLPLWLPDYLPYAWEIAMGTLSIAFIGLLQTAVIARRLEGGPEARLDLAREVRAQGLANICAAFTSAMPVSGSFNRSAAHVEAGARSVLSAIAASLLLLLLAARYGAGLICYLPLPVTGGVLMYIGWRLVDWPACARLPTRFDRGSRQYCCVMLCVVFVGITAAVFLTVAMSIAAYLRHRAEPLIRVDHDDPRFALTVTFDGELFFGSVDRLEDALHLACGDGASVKLVLRASYIDADGHALLAMACRRSSDRGGGLHVVLDTPTGATELAAATGAPAAACDVGTGSRR